MTPRATAMLRCFPKRFRSPALLVVYSALLITSCRHDARNVDTSGIDVTVAAERFEKDLFADPGNAAFLKARYGSFFDLFVNQIVHLGIMDSAAVAEKLVDFVHDSDIVNIHRDVVREFEDAAFLNKELTDAFRHYKFYFPEKPVPRVITFLSGFNYAVVSADSMLGIGLDMYLGSGSKYYPALQLPEYKIRKMSREYIACDAVKGWAQSEWEEDPSNSDLLSQVIYEGKILYFTDLMMPGVPDSVKTGYTAGQLAWCEASEKSIWSFFIDNNLLFSSDQLQVSKYVNDGPTTNGFPKESPGNIGQWIGFRIVRAWMEQQPDRTLGQLMSERDYRKIFRESKYKPAK